jgi:hypothetical protein
MKTKEKKGKREERREKEKKMYQERVIGPRDRQKKGLVERPKRK